MLMLCSDYTSRVMGWGGVGCGGEVMGVLHSKCLHTCMQYNAHNEKYAVLVMPKKKLY